MKITIFAAGSRGDIQPCVALSKALQKAGYTITLAAPENFAGFAAEHGISFHPLRGDVQQIMASDTGKKFMQTGGANPIKSIRAIRTLVEPVIMGMAEDAYAATAGADALICLGVQSAFGSTIAESLQIPLMHIEPTPLLPSKAFAAPSWPIQRDFGGLHNHFSGTAMLQVIWLWYRPFVNAFRDKLGLSGYSGARFLRTLRTTPMLSAYSPKIIPKPADWPENIHIGGYLFLNDPGSWQPPEALEDFINNGAPPVCIGFGSMGGRSPERLARLAAEALEKSGQRGVLLKGWGGMEGEYSADRLFIMESAPHSWLYPHMAAVVHHGGAGTTAEGLRAGVPTVIVPFAFDQSFWGARICESGLGPKPIPLKQLTADRLAESISSAVKDQGMRDRARSCGEAIRNEDGAGSAVRMVRQYLGNPDAGG